MTESAAGELCRLLNRSGVRYVVDDLSPDLLPLWSTDRTFIPGALDAEGTIDGVRVRCMSAPME